MATIARTFRYFILCATLTGFVTVPSVWAQHASATSGRSADRTPASRQAEDRSTGPQQPPPPAAASAVPRTIAPARQPEPQRQAEPQRQPEPQRQRDSRRHDADRHRDEPPARGNSGWQDPGPAWRSVGPAWPDTSRPNVTPRPGEDRFRSTPDTYGTRDHGRNRQRSGNGSVYVGYPYLVPYGYSPYYPSTFIEPEPAPQPVGPARERDVEGYLRLRVQPRTADVYVDGEYAGVVDDFGGTTQRLLPAGPHRVEISASGYAPITVDVRIPANDTVTFTHTLERGAPRPTPAPAAEPVIPHKPTYVVPRCYIGDVPPRPGDLPEGCKLEELRIIP